MYKNIKPEEWIVISIANEAGYDKMSWEDRITLGKQLLMDYIDGTYDPEYISEEDKKKGKKFDNFLLIKRLKEAKNVIEGKGSVPTIYLDATASGLQILSAISLDINSGSKVNIGTSERRDVYTDSANEFSEMFGLDEISREDIKKPLMTYFYNSEAKIKELLGDDNAELFFDYLNEGFQGPVKVMNILRELYEPSKAHVWILPDMKIYVPTEKQVTESITCKGIGLPYTYYVNEPDNQWRSLAPNIVHSLDAWILRYVVNKFKELNKPISVIHDSFQVSVNDAVLLINTYKEAFVTMVEDEIFISILRDLGLNVAPYNKERKNKMIEAIKNSNYMLS